MKIVVSVLFFLIVFLGGTLFYAKQLPAESIKVQSVRMAGDVSGIWTKLAEPKNYPTWRNNMRAVMPIVEDSLGLKEWKEVFSRKVFLVRRMQAFIPDSLTLEFIPEERNVRTTWTWKLEPLPPDSVLITLTSTRILGAPLYRLSNHFWGSVDELQEAVIKDISR